MLRENKRNLDKAVRELDRERMQMSHQEKRLIVDMKKLAKSGQADTCKVLAKSLIRTRKQITKFYQLKAQLQAVSLKMQTLKSSQAMADAMKGVTKAMGTMNGQLNLPQLTRTLREFEKQNERMEMTSEVMGDAMDDVFEEDGEEEETDELVSQVMDEIGISTTAALMTAPAARVAQAEAPQAEEPQLMAEGMGGGGGGDAGRGAPGGAGGGGAGGGIDADLQARLKNLRG